MTSIEFDGRQRLDGLLVWDGFRQLLPVSFFVIVFGAAFGLSAAQAGIDNESTLVMSTLVFAGYAQFATLELWGPQISIIPLVITVFVINARHLLMGASLYPWLRRIPPVKRYAMMLVASDANWAMSMQAFRRGQPGLGLFLGGGLAIWFFWVLGTALGVYFGGLVENPASLGLDMAMGCFLLAIAIDGDKNPRTLAIWAIAACASLMAYWYLPENSHVISGAIAGGIAGIAWPEGDDGH